MSHTQELHNYTYFGISDKGSVREKNEDRFAHIESINGNIFVLCDGMGGVKGGDIAAEITIKSIENYVSENWQEDPKTLMYEAIKIANKDVFNHFKNNNSLLKAGTTLVFVLVRNNEVYYAHVGDSRIYYQTGKKLFQITSDHSYVQGLVDKNIITEEEALLHPRKNEILKAIGIKENVEPTICSTSLSPADYDSILLCSDGLSNELTKKEIISILLNNKLLVEKKAKALINKAIDNGGRDNVTVQLINFYNTGKTKSISFKPKSNNKKKYKFIFLAGLVLLLSFILFIILTKKDAPINKLIDRQHPKNSSLLFYKKHKKDTIINIFVKNTQNLQTILTSYNLTHDKIGHASSLVKNFGYVKYYIPVNAVYKYQIGKELFSYPEINKQNIIDVIIVNNKQELFFKPGENIIVP